ncbi:MAG: hypothetical protein IPM23_01470 [Candidatus Melainabacteria bacterium]|nr:hypothetical protein [Candidatus Melainabacteria bacterium]
MKTVTRKIGFGCRRHKSRLSLSGLSCDGPGCHIDIFGAGKEDYPFPTINQLVEGALARAGKVPEKEEPKETTVAPSMEPGEFWQDVSVFLPRLGEFEEEPDLKAMVDGAEALRQLMDSRRFDGLVDVRFSSMIGATLWARQNMPAGFQKTLNNLLRQISRLKRRYKKALRKLVLALSHQARTNSLDELVAQATDLLDQELAESLAVLRVYTDSFNQYRDGAYARELELINFFFEQTASLFQPAEGIKTSKFKVGDRYIARIVTGELATMPGALGPVGLHALEVPVEMLDFLFLLMPLMAHELFHDIYYDVEGLEQELTEKVAKAIETAVNSGKVKLTSTDTAFGAGSVPTLELLQKLFKDLLSEIAADICGGILFSGPAFITTMLVSFPAMGMGDTPIAEEPRLLSSTSEFTIEEKEDGRMELTFEPHPVDYVRVLGLAEALKVIGMDSEAEPFGALAVFGAGKPRPEFVTYTAEGGREDLTLRFAVVDLQALAPVVARVLIEERLDCLGKRSMWEMYNWTGERQEIVGKLAASLVKGRYSVPRKLGSVHANYVGAAAPLAFWELIKTGKNPVEAARAVNKNAMKMLATLHKRGSSK